MVAFLSVLLLLLGAFVRDWVMPRAHASAMVADDAVASAPASGSGEERRINASLDALARKLGEMQARMQQVEALGERVAEMSGIVPQEMIGVDSGESPGQGGVLVNPSALPLSVSELQAQLDALDALAVRQTDLFTAVESQLFEQKIRALMLPTQEPVAGVRTGSGFGRRIDPFSGRSATHTGLDFPAPTGTPILAAAGGIVVEQRWHGEYGNMVEIDHGNGLVTRYAHASKVLVKRGDLVRRGQEIAKVGSTGRSTGAHLHFEVLMNGTWQNPAKFLAMGRSLPESTHLAQAPKTPQAP